MVVEQLTPDRKLKPNWLSRNRRKYYFDRKAANNVVSFFERELYHVEGEKSGELFKLEIWQRKILRRLFGWKHRATGLRRFRSLFLFISRKNGKSILAAGLAIYLLVADKEPGCKIAGVAADREQAQLVYDVAKAMVDSNPRLSQYLTTHKRTMSSIELVCNYSVLSADAKRKHGRNLHGLICDEVHEQPSFDLINNLKTGMGARRQPMQVYCSTAGVDDGGVCKTMYQQAKAVLAGESADETLLPVIYEAGETDDWKDREVWKKANPNLGVSINMEFLETEFIKAIENPAYENTFKQLYLNMWVEQETRWLPVEWWDECADINLTEEALYGQECYAGLDLASVDDLTALILAFELQDDMVAVIPYFWVPRDTIPLRVKKTKHPYDRWAREGLIETTEGAACDYGHVRKRINEIREKFYIRELVVEHWNSAHISQQIESDGLQVVTMYPSFSRQTAPTRKLEELIINRKIVHSGHEVLRWNFKNIAVDRDFNNGIRISKVKAKEKIDGMSAMVCALSALILRLGLSEGSVYDDHEITVL